jgi:hypothetical protein
VSLLRKLGVFVIVLMLTTTIASANVITATHRTVLDPDYVSNSLDDAGAYEGVQDIIESRVNDSFSGTGQFSDLISSALDDVVTEQYVRSQANANINRTYGYLHGNRGELNISIDTTPLKTNAVGAVEDTIRNESIADLYDTFAGDSTEESVGEGASVSDVIDPETISQMTESKQQYQAAREDFRSGIREEVITTAADRRYENASNDERLSLIIEDYNPREYSEAEKERMVADNETRIRSAIRDRVREEQGDAINETVDRRLDGFVGQAENQTSGNAESNVTAAAAELQLTIVQGLAGDMSYDEFSSELEGDRDTLATAVGTRIEGELDDSVSDRLSLTDELGPETEQQLSDARGTVQLLDTLGTVLPVAVLVLVGLIFLLTRSIKATLNNFGRSLFLVGLPTFVGIQLLSGQIKNFVPSVDDGMQPIVDGLVGVIGDMLGVLGSQSLWVMVGGMLLIVTSWAIKPDSEGDGDSGGTASQAATTQTPPDGDAGASEEPAESGESENPSEPAGESQSSTPSQPRARDTVQTAADRPDDDGSETEE